VHLWFRYQTPSEDGVWPLPQLIEARNVYWNHEWLPRPKRASNPGALRPIGFRLPGDALVIASPESERSLRPGTLGGRFAVVLDRSRSMATIQDRVAAAFSTLDAALGADGDFDLYLTSAKSRGEPPSRVLHARGFDARAVVDFGGQSARELLEQFEALRGNERYDGVVVLSDRGGYELTRAGPAGRCTKSAPIWWVHLGGELPAAYDDATLEAIQSSGGGVTTSVDQALARLGQAIDEAGDLGVAGGYAWTLAHRVGPEPNIEWASPNLGPLAAARLLGAAIRTGVDAQALDRLHALARSVGIVSPYSSMIVVVNDLQWQRLTAAEAASDRFEREVENGDKPLDLPPPSALVTISATPEPAEWALLILLAAGLLAMAAMQQSFWTRRDAARTSSEI
jgi:putative PEP-CTERM system integral membrane protein